MAAVLGGGGGLFGESRSPRMRILADRRRPVGEGRGIRESNGEDTEDDIEGDGTVAGALPVV